MTMRTLFRLIMTTALLALLPMTLLAMSHEQHESSHQHAPGEQQKHVQHDGMIDAGTMFIVGDMTSKGVRGMAHLQDTRTAMAEMGMKTTHHFMIAFVDVETGKQIESGKVALKLQDPNGKVSDTIELIGMQGHFGADIVIDKEGEYHFKLGTQLADGVKRKYHFHHQMK
jgi:hypothetical protein